MRDRLFKLSITLCPPIQNSAKWRWLQLLLLVISLLPLATSCKTLLLPGQSFLPGQSKEVSLQMEVAPNSDRSRYIVSGNTNLPDNTSITVAAIRYFNTAKNIANSADATDSTSATFAVLDYTSTTVKQGKWQAELALNQQGEDGRPWEAWQMQQSKLGLSLQPDETVSFVTTLKSMDQLVPLEQQLAEKGFRLPRGMIRSTTEGQRYAEVSQTIALAPPNPGQKPPSAAEPHNYGWGDRYLLVKEPQNPTRLERPKEPQTTAPPTAPEFLR